MGWSKDVGSDLGCDQKAETFILATEPERQRNELGNV